MLKIEILSVKVKIFLKGKIYKYLTEMNINILKYRA